MKEAFAAIGVLCMLLASGLVMLLPVGLAIWVSPVWLWMYAFYILFFVGAGYAAVRYSNKRNIGGNR